MRSAVAALSSLEESLFAARSVLGHVRDINRALALADADLAPAVTRPPRCRLLPVSSITRAKTLSRVQHQEYLNLVVAEADSQIGALGELIQDHRERLDYHLFLIQDRFSSAARDVEPKYRAEIENLKKSITSKKAELNRLYELKEGKPSLQTRLEAAKEKLREVRAESAERLRVTQEINERTLQLQRLHDGDAGRVKSCRDELRELHKQIEQNSIRIDQDSVVKQLTAILRACGASSHSLRAMKRIVMNGFSCRLSDFGEEFPLQSDAAQQALKNTLAELHALGLVHFPEEGVVAVGRSSSMP